MPIQKHPMQSMATTTAQAGKSCPASPGWTGFFTRGFANPRSPNATACAGLSLLACTFLLTGCQGGERDFGFAIEIVQAQQAGNTINVRARQEVDLSEEAREALRHGVPIRLRLDLAVRRQGGWSDIQNTRLNYQLNYLPLSDRYQVSGPLRGRTGEMPAEAAVVSTFPRLRHALAAMTETSHQFDGIAPYSGPYEIRARSRIDRSGMPGPMQLPAFLSAGWRHDSGWVSRAVDSLDGDAG